jgi:hypothetical protein
MQNFASEPESQVAKDNYNFGADFGVWSLRKIKVNLN